LVAKVKSIIPIGAQSDPAHCKLQEEKSKCAGLAWEIGFAAAADLLSLLRLVTGEAQLCTC
jgi:hypothetical protein